MASSMHLPAEVKSKMIQELYLEVQGCRRCGLWRGRRNPVLGEGNINSKVFLVGEAPGRKEDETGRPFTGAAGQLLDDLLLGIGLSRGSLYVGNMVKCRPPGNRAPRVEEVEACFPYLERQFEVLEPRLIVSMGNTATLYLMNYFKLRPMHIGMVHGKPLRAEASWGRIILFPSYHPASALYLRRLEGVLRRDFESLKGILDGIEVSHD